MKWEIWRAFSPFQVVTGPALAVTRRIESQRCLLLIEDMTLVEMRHVDKQEFHFWRVDNTQWAATRKTMRTSVLTEGALVLGRFKATWQTDCKLFRELAGLTTPCKRKCIEKHYNSTKKQMLECLEVLRKYWKKITKSANNKDKS